MLLLRSCRSVCLACAAAVLIALLLLSGLPRGFLSNIQKATDSNGHDSAGRVPDVTYLPQPTWTPPPVKDPFPRLDKLSSAPPIPSWNKPRKGVHKEYGIDYPPPLFIGFTRTWPILLQAVVSYITAGWPPEQIYVVENTGVLDANLKGRLTLQNPFFLNHAQLQKLGVHVVQAPVLMSFSQLQNFYTYLAQSHGWPFYFWSHMDVLVLSYEDGMEGLTARAGEEGYRSLYELCLRALKAAMDGGERWASRFFAYDQLTLVNREAYEEVGGWDPFIPYYMNDCDMHSRLLMHNWTQVDVRAGIITDVSTVLEDLGALYRDLDIEPAFVDPNPPPPETGKNEDKRSAREKRVLRPEELDYYEKLKAVADRMFHYKHGGRGRNTWQVGQQGSRGEPYSYPARGIAVATEVLTEAGREVFRRKWGHRDCDLVTGTKLKSEDQWEVARDWD